jgi:hypothetical protein
MVDDFFWSTKNFNQSSLLKNAPLSQKTLQEPETSYKLKKRLEKSDL